MTELRGKVAIVTGASRGIGAAAARLLAQEGAIVLMAARTKSELESTAADLCANGWKAVPIVTDVTRYADIDAIVRMCTREYGRLDILINNAATIEPIARIGDSDPEAWSKAADINYKGVYFGLRAAIPVMEEQAEGVIINISSGAATGALEGWSHYCSTKAAVLSLTRCVDKEYWEKGIRIVGLSPGTVATEMQVAIRDSGINPVSRLEPSDHITPEWVARAILYLCTSAAEDLHGVDFSIKTEEGRRRVGLI